MFKITPTYTRLYVLKVVGKRKKRTNKSASKTSVSSKKAKKATPKKKAGKAITYPH